MAVGETPNVTGRDDRLAAYRDIAAKRESTNSPAGEYRIGWSVEVESTGTLGYAVVRTVELLVNGCQAPSRGFRASSEWVAERSVYSLHAPLDIPSRRLPELLGSRTVLLSAVSGSLQLGRAVLVGNDIHQVEHASFPFLRLRRDA
jgi:hypothetical protein